MPTPILKNTIMLRAIRNNIVKKVAARHVAGSNIEDALEVCRWAYKECFSTILSPWSDWSNEKESPREKSQRKTSMLERFKRGLDAIHTNNFSSYLSIKLDAIDYDVGAFKDLLELGKRYNIRIHVDSLGPETVTKTFHILEKAAVYHENMGCTLPSRWQRSLEDAARAADWGLAVRVVKGQWADPQNKVDSKQNYLAIVERLAGNARHVGIATHDTPLAHQALEILGSSGTSHEMEQFFSLPLNGIKTAKKHDCGYRLYVSYGHPAIPYNYRFALTRPSLAAWMMSDLLLNLKKPWSNHSSQHHEA